MRTLRNTAALACILSAATLANDPECRRLVDVLAPRTFGKGFHSLQLAVPASQNAQWFLSASGEDPAWVEIDGRVVVAPVSLAGRQDRATVSIQLRANSRLSVLVPGRNDRVTIRVLGILPASDLGQGVGTPVGEVQVFDQLLPGGFPARKTRITVAAPGSDGVLSLTAERSGQPHVALSMILWNDEAVLGPTDFLNNQPPVVRPVLSRASNTLEAWVLGFPGSRLRVRLKGWVTDPTAPTAAWESPAEGAAVGPGSTFRLTWSDVGTGVDPTKVKVTLNGEDVTSAFTVSEGSATALFQALPASALVAGANTLRATVKDRACNSVTVERRFTTGDQPDTVPPVVQQPGNLIVEQAGPAGTVVTFPLPLATDDRDPAPVVTCTPPSGSLFPAGVTTVVCTARDQAGNVSQPVSFTVTVQDTIAPVLAQPEDLVVEQAGPAGTVVNYAPPAASDAVDPNPSVVCNPPPGLFPGGVTIVTCTAQDAAGNTSEPVTFRVTVRDTTAPQIATLPDLVIEQAGPAGSVVTFASPVATDTVDTSVEVVCEPPSGSVFPAGSSVVQCMATDDSGNVATSFFMVLVVDRTAPSVSIASPASGSVSYPHSTLRVEYADAVATVASTLVVLAQGRDVTGLLTRGAGFAEARLENLGLDQGQVDVSARIHDPSGNEGSAASSFTYSVPPAVTALVIEIPPAPAAPLVLGQSYDLTLRAVTTTGDVATTFTGIVVLQTTDPSSLLNGVVVDFAPIHSGVRTLPGVAEFGSEGTHTVTAVAVEGPAIQGQLELQVARSDRGRVLVVVASGEYLPGQTIQARVFVDAGPTDCQATTFQDTLGAYDVRLLFDRRQLEVLRVDGGASALGAPLFVLPGSIRLMDLNEQGSLSVPVGPDSSATGLVEVASIDLRVRSQAPSGMIALAAVGDALTTAAPAADHTFVLSPVGPLGPRMGEVEGQVSVASQYPAAGLVVLGVLPRDGEGLVAGPQAALDPRAVLSAPVDPTTLGNVTLLLAGQPVHGVARLGDSSTEVRFTPDAPLVPGEYTLEVGPGLAALGGGALGMPHRTTFVVGSVSSPRPADLDRDGEIAVLDLQVRRDVLLGRTAGTVPDFPPVFLKGAPGTVQVGRVGDTDLALEVADPQGGPISMVTANLPPFAQLIRTGGDNFRLTVSGNADGGALDLTAANGSGETSSARLQIVPERNNRPPGLLLVKAEVNGESAGDPIRVREGDPLTLTVLASDPDFADPITPDHVTFLPSSFPNVAPPTASGVGDVAEYVFTPGFDQAGDHTIELPARDDTGAEGTLAVQVKVLNTNRAPVFTAVLPEEPLTSLPGLGTMTFSWTAEDPDGSPVQLAVANGPLVSNEYMSFTVSSSPGQLQVTAVPRQTEQPGGNFFTLTAVASDGDALSSESRSYQWPPPPPTGPPPLQNPLAVAIETSQPNHGFPRGLVPFHTGDSGQQGSVRLLGLRDEDLTPEGLPASMRVIRAEGGGEIASVQYIHPNRTFVFTMTTPLVLGAPPVPVILEVTTVSGLLRQTGLSFVHDGLIGEGEIPDPALLFVSNTSYGQLHVRVRVHNAQLAHSFQLGGVLASLSVGIPPDFEVPEPLGTVDYDLIINRPRPSGTLRLSVRYRGLTNPLPEPPFEIELQEAMPVFPTALMRYGATGELERLVRDQSFGSGNEVMPILPEGANPLLQSTGPENPYVLFLAAPRNPSPFPSPELPGTLSVSPLSELKTSVELNGPSRGPLHYPHTTDVATDYRISPPIFLVYRYLPPATLTPVLVLPDRIIVSIGRPGAEPGRPPAGPFPNDTSGDFGEVYSSAGPISPFVPGFAIVTPPVYPVLVGTTSHLDGAGVWCNELVAAYDPYLRRSDVRAEIPSDSGQYVTLNGDPATHPSETWFPVHRFMEESPGFVAGPNRLRMYGPGGDQLFQATFDLLIANRAMAAKTSPDDELLVDYSCDGARVGDPAQARYVQADLPLDDEIGPGTARAGATVLLATGEELLERTDLVIPGIAGLDFKLVRRYRSQVHYDGPMGYGWDLNLFEKLAFVSGVEEDADELPDGRGNPPAIWRQNGKCRVAVWTRDANSSRYLAGAGHFGILLHETGPVAKYGPRYVLRMPDGMKHYYSEHHGGLTEIEDRFGNVMKLVYDHDHQVDYVLDVFGRTIDFTYAKLMSPTAGHKIGRLISVKDFTDRTVVYAYDTLGDLVEAHTPEIDGERRTELYTYYSGYGSPDPNDSAYRENKLNHNLKSVTSPEEAAAVGDPSLQLVYGTDIDAPLSYDKVIQETVGGTNASNIPAGGTRHFSYHRDPDPAYLSDLQVQVTEPNELNIHWHHIDKARREIAVRKLGMGLRPVEPPFGYITTTRYNPDGLVTSRSHPEGNSEEFKYGAGLRGGQRYVTEHIRRPGLRASNQSILITKYTYEPLFNQIASITDARESASEFLPPDAPSPEQRRGVSPGRYTTRFIYDYQEGGETAFPDAERFGIDVRSLIEIRKGDLNGDGTTQQAVGNVVMTVHPTVTLDADSNEGARTPNALQHVVTLSRWNSKGQLTATVDPLGYVTEYRYYSSLAPEGPSGGGSQAPSRSSEGGYLAARIVDSNLVVTGADHDPPSPRRPTDPTPRSLTTRFGYDRLGNMTAIFNPRGVRTDIEYNAVNQVVRVVKGANVPAGINEPAFKQETTQRYDRNGRVVEVVTGVRTAGLVSSRVTRALTYDMLGDVVANTVSWGGTAEEPAGSVTTQYRYDKNRNRVETISPENRKVAVEFDERDLPMKITRGAGTSEASTIQLDYDKNGNLSRVTDAEDTDGQGGSEVTTYTYDGYDRLLSTIEPNGRTTSLKRDPVGNVVAQEVGDPTLLYRIEFDFDELNRSYKAREHVFGPQVEPQVVISRTELDAASRVTFTVDPYVTTDQLKPINTTLHDGAGRPIETRDALGNRTVVDYDDNGNATQVTSFELAPGNVVPLRVFRSRARFDQLDRLVLAVDPAGHTHTFTYDARDNVVLETDAEGPTRQDPVLGVINEAGNTRRMTYDGLDRLVSEVRALRLEGRGPGGVVGPAGYPEDPTAPNAGALDTTNPSNPDGLITMTYLYDKDSLLVGIKDDNGRVTSFGYDALGRKTTQTMADNSVYRTTYDRDDNVKTVTDANGSVLTRKLDALSRVVELTVAPLGSGVIGTTKQTFAYDGLSRQIRSTDNNGAPTGEGEVCQWTYDSLGRALTETQNSWTVTSKWAGDGRRDRLTYPGGRSLTYAHDLLDRVTSTIEGATTIAKDDWVGPGARLLNRELGIVGSTPPSPDPNNPPSPPRGLTELKFSLAGVETGYDQAKRVIDLLWRVRDTAEPIVHRSYTYNRASYRTSEVRREEANLTDSFTYDSAYRIQKTSYDRPASAREASYVLDGVGNRRSVTDVTTKAYEVNSVNAYSTIDGTVLLHDANGNLRQLAGRGYQFDALDRLVKVTDRVAGVDRQIAAYSYFADGRRSRVQEWSIEGTPIRDVRFVYDGQREIEERDSASGQTLASFVWGSDYVDSLVQLQRNGRTYYVHQDARFNIVAITDDRGVVQERRKFDDFGAMSITPSAPDQQVGLDYGFQGRRHDQHTGLVYFRARFYDPLTGRFLSRDPVWSPESSGNQYAFGGNSPASALDPSGEVFFVAVPAWLAFTALTASGAGIYAAQDYYVQSVTSAGFTAGEFDWQSTAKSAGWGAVDGFTSGFGGAGAGTIGRRILARAGSEIAGNVVAHGIGLAIQQGMGSPAEAEGWGNEDDFDNCFLAGTRVETASRGGVAIEDVRVGERIAPPPDHSCEDSRCGEVVNLFRNTTDQVVTITTVARLRAREHRAAGRDSGEGGEEEGEPPSSRQTIRCTPGHPFFVKGWGWVFAGDLQPGDALDARGEQVYVAEVEVRAERAETFNFEVRCHHTYRVSGAVGQPALLVHNKSNVFKSALRAAERRVGARTFARHHVPRPGGRAPRYYLGGLAGERALTSRLGAGARREITFGGIKLGKQTVSRRIDVLHKGGGLVGHESKVGWVRNSPFFREEVLKDAALLRANRLAGVEWHFYRSHITGEIGADPAILGLLTRNKIPYFFHD